MLDHYHLIKNLGSGGMGEVFIANDTVCERVVALKRIRKDLERFPSIVKRFLREALIAAKLNHPSIIPIFSISQTEGRIYYTMPYIKGKTLKQILKEAKQNDHKGAILFGIRVFFNICQAVAYSHSKGILHRDLKPENVMIGKFGEVLILDWGLAEYTSKQQEKEEEWISQSQRHPTLTSPGKVVGTLAYLAPERTQEEEASEQSDLYALGVILYQILTLNLPFKRNDLECLKKNWPYEEFVDPIEIAPHRDIPHGLSQITKKCLQPLKQFRYQHVSDLVADLEGFIEGRPDWILIKELKIEDREAWEFQENILLAKHLAITRSTQIMEWVNLMISKEAFPGNLKIEASVCLGKNSHGIGFLLNIPEKSERKSLLDGYCVWIDSKNISERSGCRLFRCNIEVIEALEVTLEPGIWYQVCIEKVESHLSVFIDQVLKMHYISHIPLSGIQVGLLLKDADLELTKMTVFNGSQNVKVSCLAIPDAFLASKEYAKALSEYHKIALSFPGRVEEREAIFRSGITFLEAGLQSNKKNAYFTLALEKFGELRTTAGAPLEYLGKSFVYKVLMNAEEEAKCMELALRKYSKHPLFSRLSEHAIFRLHESSSYNRIAAYHFALLTLRHLPQAFANPDHQRVIDSMKKNWGHLHLFHPEAITVYLAFFLAKTTTLIEFIEADTWAEDSFYALLELGCFSKVEQQSRITEFPSVEEALEARRGKALELLQKGVSSRQLQRFLIQYSFDQGNAELVLPFIAEDPVLKLWALLFTHRTQEAGMLFNTYSAQQLSQENSPLFPLFGSYLWVTQGEEVASNHFRTASESPYLHTPSLIAHFLFDKVDFKKKWFQTMLLWEKMELYRQLIVFYRCLDQPKEVDFFFAKLHKLKKICH